MIDLTKILEYLSWKYRTSHQSRNSVSEFYSRHSPGYSDRLMKLFCNGEIMQYPILCQQSNYRLNLFLRTPIRFPDFRFCMAWKEEVLRGVKLCLVRRWCNAVEKRIFCYLPQNKSMDFSMHCFAASICPFFFRHIPLLNHVSALSGSI